MYSFMVSLCNCLQYCVGFVLNENRPDGDPAVRVIQQFEAQLKAHQVLDFTMYYFLHALALHR